MQVLKKTYYSVAQKERMFFQIIVTLFIFNIKELC